MFTAIITFVVLCTTILMGVSPMAQGASLNRELEALRLVEAQEASIELVEQEEWAENYPYLPVVTVEITGEDAEELPIHPVCVAKAARLEAEKLLHRSIARFPTVQLMIEDYPTFDEVSEEIDAIETGYFQDRNGRWHNKATGGFCKNPHR